MRTAGAAAAAAVVAVTVTLTLTRREPNAAANEAPPAAAPGADARSPRSAPTSAAATATAIEIDEGVSPPEGSLQSRGDAPPRRPTLPARTPGARGSTAASPSGRPTQAKPLATAPDF